MLFSLQYASAKSWLDSGLQVDTLIGHSFGQLTALCVAGSLSLLDALRLVSGRAHLIQDFWGPESGEMLSMEGEMENVHGILEQTKCQHPSFSADIACYNGPKNIVIAGTQASIDALEATYQSGSWPSTLKVIRLKNTHAFHSQLVDGIVPSLLQLAATLEFRPPTIRIETCSKGQTWSQIGAEQIVQHSRMPVYFEEAVERTAERLKSSVWIEAGSGSPIISMTRRVLTAQSSHEHVFQSIDLGASDAQSKLARATGSLWKAGVNTQFWLFHHAQKSTYTWINLPPYQFEKTSHWIDYIEPSASLPADTVKVPPTKETNELLDLLDRRQEDGLFAVNTASNIFRLCTKGHAVLRQSLCPASMYVEMAVRATSLLVNNNLSSSAPHVQDMKISSPLPLNPDQKVLLQLSRDEQENMSWKFTLFSRSDGGSVTYATGSVALFAFDNAATSARFQSLKRLVSQARLEHVFHSPSSNGLKGDVIYKTFGQVVDYESYYRGVQKIGSNQNEAVGDVSLPDGQPSALAQSACDPITLDNFLQVAGIHVNCLAESKEGEVSVCTEIGELLLSEAFMAKRQDRRSWTVYSNFERTPGNSVTNDIFAFDAATGDLIALLTNIKFHSVPLKSLAKTLAKLNGDSGVAASRKSGYSFDTDDIARPVNGNIEPERFIREGRVPTRGDDTQTDQHEVLEQVRELIKNILEVPVQDITLDASPEDLGIDSLLVTEVLGEIKKRFGVTMSISDFQQIDNLRTLAQRLQPQSPTARRPVQVPSKAQVKVEKSSVSKRAEGPSALTQVQKMLGDVLEIPVSDITPETALSDLGVDSLLVTEVLSEIKKRFHVSLSVKRFQDLGDVHSLADQLRPPRSSHAEQPNGHSAHESHVSETEAFAVSAHSSFVKVRRNFDAITESVRFAKFWQSVYPAQMELVVAYIVDAFTSLGCPLASLRPGQRLPDISLLPKHSKLKNQLYRILLDQNIIQRDLMDEYVRTNAPTPRTAADVLHKNIISRFPQHVSEHELLRSTASKLADCLTGREDPLGLLFGDAKARHLMEEVYTNAPMFKAGTINLAQYLTDAIHRSYDGTREVRILELGAGTGGTTKYLVEELSAKTQAKFQYTFTDLSSSLVAAARKKFSKHSFMRYTVMNIEEDPGSQFLGQYDIVISTNCIHATRHLTRSCTNIRKLLRPGGVLCLVELTRNLFWFDLVFGLLEGWWLFEDGRQHALAEEGLWQRHLRQSGYRWIDWTEGHSDESRILRVITASPFEGLPLREQDTPRVTQETVEFKKADDLSLFADIYYPEKVANESKQLPVGEREIY
jgi:acyl carrier protein